MSTPDSQANALFRNDLSTAQGELKPLTEEEAQSLVALLQNRATPSDQITQAQRRLINGSMALITPIALRFRQPGLELSDMRQDAFIKLAAIIPKEITPHKPPIGNYFHWVKHVIGNFYRDVLKKVEAKPYGDATPYETRPCKTSPAAPPDQYYDAHETQKALETFTTAVKLQLRQLSPCDQEYLFRYALGQSVSAIATDMEKTPSSVHMGISRARQRLIDKLEKPLEHLETILEDRLLPGTKELHTFIENTVLQFPPTAVPDVEQMNTLRKAFIGALKTEWSKTPREQQRYLLQRVASQQHRLPKNQLFCRLPLNPQERLPSLHPPFAESFAAYTRRIAAYFSGCQDLLEHILEYDARQFILSTGQKNTAKGQTKQGKTSAYRHFCPQNNLLFRP